MKTTLTIIMDCDAKERIKTFAKEQGTSLSRFLQDSSIESIERFQQQ